MKSQEQQIWRPRLSKKHLKKTHTGLFDLVSHWDWCSLSKGPAESPCYPPPPHPPDRPAIHLFSCVRGGRGQLPVECTREQTCWWCALNRWYCGGLVFMRGVYVCAYWVRLGCERRAAAAGCLASYPGPCEVNIISYLLTVYQLICQLIFQFAQCKFLTSLGHDFVTKTMPYRAHPLVTKIQTLNWRFLIKSKKWHAFRWILTCKQKTVICQSSMACIPLVTDLKPFSKRKLIKVYNN